MPRFCNAVGIMGGTFDPIHFGHLRTALEIKQNLDLHEIHLLPCHIPGHRPEPEVSAQDRINMLNISIADDPELQLDERECRSLQTSYTVNTLKSYRDEKGDKTPLLMIMGMDAFSKLHEWHQWEQIFKLAHIIVAHRPKTSLPDEEPLKTIINTHRLENKKALHESPSGYLYFQTVTALDISSSKIRKLIKEDKSPKYLLHDKVWEYIKSHHLYGYK